MRKQVALFLVLSLPLLSASPAGKAKNFRLPTLDGKTMELQKMLKKGPVLVDFWATWCKPCLKAFPELEKLHRKYAGRGVQVVGVNEDGPGSLKRVKPFVAKLGVSFPILLDEKNALMRQWQVQVLPTTFLVGQDGTILQKHVGYSSNSVKKLDQAIANILKKPRR